MTIARHFSSAKLLASSVLCELLLIIQNGIVPVISRTSVQGWAYSFTWVFSFLANDVDSVMKRPWYLVSEVLGIMLLGDSFFLLFVVDSWLVGSRGVVCHFVEVGC